MCVYFFFFKQKTAYEMRISDWSSDVCSSDLAVLSVRVYTTLATEWLIPRLQTFRERHPEIEIKLVASLNRIDFDTDTADVALLPMAGPNSSLRQDPLFQPQFTPVCSPRLIQRGPPLRHPRDLRGCTARKGT